MTSRQIYSLCFLACYGALVAFAVTVMVTR
jgi:hypothetical protein